MAFFLKKWFGGDSSVIATDFLKFVEVDMHSHVLPGLDDGSESLEQSVAMVRELYKLGYRKLTMTPHVMGDFYKNSPEDIRTKLEELKQEIQKQQIPIDLACAAEYYLDEWFVQKLDDNQPLLTFGENYLLFETSFINEPIHFQDIVFKIKSNGYTPVLAHPERYAYLYHRFNTLIDWHSSGLLFQVNLNSLVGYYGQEAKKVADKLLENNCVDFVGTDAHSEKHLMALQKLVHTKAYKILLQKPLRNQLI